MYCTLHGEMATKDAIARELLAEADNTRSGDPDRDSPARGADGRPSFLSEDREVAVEILTGDAQ